MPDIEQVENSRNDDFLTPEHELWRAVIRKALEEASYKKVVFNFRVEGLPFGVIKYMRSESAVAWLTCKNNNFTCITNLCEITGIRYDRITNFLNTDPLSYENIATIEFDVIPKKRREESFIVVNESKARFYGFCFDIDKIYAEAIGQC